MAEKDLERGLVTRCRKCGQVWDAPFVLTRLTMTKGWFDDMGPVEIEGWTKRAKDMVLGHECGEEGGRVRA